jgi:phage gp46-like protein
MTGSIIEDATQYAKDALKWLTEDGVASKVDVVVSRVQGENETLLFQVDVYRPDELQPLKYQIIWDAYRAFIDPSIVSIPESILSLPLSFGYGSGAGEDMVLDPDAYKEPSVINIGDDLYESICISLFTEKRFRFVDGESPSDDRRGWWFDSVRGDQDLTGSLLWTLDFRAMAGNIIDDATQYAKDALKWLTDDGVASRVEVVVTRTANETLSFAVDVYRPDELQPLKYQIIWDASLNYIKNGEL